jgi:hypothetical protein
MKGRFEQAFGFPVYNQVVVRRPPDERLSLDSALSTCSHLVITSDSR